ncbi:MAG: pitrilysin family protein [bacterium]
MQCFPNTRVLKTVATALLAFVVLVPLFPIADAAIAGDIPDRPEGLKFPELQYDPPSAADYRATLDNGVVAYLVPDLSLPLVNIHVVMRLGPDQDPAGKEGLGGIMVRQLTRGGNAAFSAEELEDRVAQLGAQLTSGMGGGRRGMMGMGGIRTGPAESFVSLNLLAKDLDAGLELLVGCLKEPAFQEDRLQLARDQVLQDMKQRNDDTADIERREWSYLIHGADHWTNRWSTEASITSFTRDDLVALHRQYVGPANFLLAVSGNFDRDEMLGKLEAAFADWPVPGENPGPPAAPTAPADPGWYAVDKDVNQARICLGIPSLDRYDPDWYAALVMNDVLGGGGFTSRLVNRIRSDEGLAYSVRAALGQGVYYADPWRAAFQTKVRSTAFAIDIALTEVRRIREELVTEDELLIAKNSFIESLPTGFETAGAIAGALAMEELTGRWQRDPDYYAEYRDRIAAVTADDVQRVAQRLLDPERMTFLIVGKVADAKLGDGKHDVSLTGLAGGEPTLLPLRDPLTMEALSE